MNPQQSNPWRVVPVLGVRDVRAAAAYYREQLGFYCDPNGGIFAPTGEDGAVYAFLEREGVTVHLQIRRREINQQREHIESDAYFYVDDADALHAELSQRGAHIVRGPEDGPSYDLRDFVVEDLDGNRLMFGSERNV